MTILKPRPQNWWQPHRETLHHDIHLDLAPAYGEIGAHDNAVPLTLNVAAWIQVTSFDTSGPSADTIPDHTNDHITIERAGAYLVLGSVTTENAAPQSHEVKVSVWLNNGATQLTNVHADRVLAAGGGDEGSMSMSGIAVLAVDDTVELWAVTDAAGDRDVIFEEVTLSIVRLGP